MEEANLSVEFQTISLTRDQTLEGVQNVPVCYFNVVHNLNLSQRLGLFTALSSTLGLDYSLPYFCESRSSLLNYS